MAVFSKKDAASTFPIDETSPLHPTRAMDIQEPTELALSITMTDITPAAASMLSPLPTDPTTLIKTAKSTASTTPPTPQLTRPNRLSHSRTAKDATDAVIAELSSPIWSLGKWTIKFPADLKHSGHNIQLHSAGAAAEADEFVKDSVLFWGGYD